MNKHIDVFGSQGSYCGTMEFEMGKGKNLMTD